MNDSDLIPVWQKYLELCEGPHKATLQAAIARGDHITIATALLKARNDAIAACGLSCEQVTPQVMEASARRLSAAKNPQFLNVLAKLQSTLAQSMSSKPTGS